MSAVEAHDLALKILAVLRKERSDECFKEFWKKLLSNKNSYAIVESPVLPCRRKIPARYNDGEDQHNHKDVELLYRQLYYDAYDYAISGIKSRFDQPDFKLYSHMQNLLLKAANGQKGGGQKRSKTAWRSTTLFARFIKMTEMLLVYKLN